MAITPEAVVRVGSGEPVVLLHPFALSLRVWSDVIDRLADTHEVLAVSLAGHWGAPPLTARTIGGYAQAVEAAMDEAGWDSAHLVGNSLGGWVALELERRGRARSVLAIAPAGGWRHVSVASVAMLVRFLSVYPLAVAGNLFGDNLLRNRWIQRRFLRTLVTDVDAVDPGAALDALRAFSHCRSYLPTMWMGLRHGGAKNLGAVSAPVMLALAERDRFLPRPRYGAMFVDQLPAHTEHRLLPGVGHVPALENPGLVADTIAEFTLRHRDTYTPPMKSE